MGDSGLSSGNSSIGGQREMSGVAASLAHSSIRSPQSYFISDLHLCDERPRINDIFFDFIKRLAPRAEALFILGDLFEYWIGDDDVNNMLAAHVAEALAALSAGGAKVFLMQGNRDVVMGDAYAQRCQATLIPDPTVIDLYGTRTLLMHGDTLCTGDIDYQKFRAYIRDPQTQAKLLAQPLAARHAQAQAIREQSEISKIGKAEEIMDVSIAAVDDALQLHQTPRIIHGHTHRPMRHQHMLQQQACERWVLSNWHEAGSYLACGLDGCRAVMLN